MYAALESLYIYLSSANTYIGLAMSPDVYLYTYLSTANTHTGIQSGLTARPLDSSVVTHIQFILELTFGK